MKTHSYWLPAPTRRFSWLLLLGALLSLAGPAAGQAARASSQPSARQRQADSVRVAALIKPAEIIARQADFSITAREQVQLQKAAQALQQWANTYLRPSYSQEAAVLRGFKYLVMVGRYYATAGDYGLAQGAYEQAQAIIPATSPLRAKEGKYAQELTSNESEVNALAAQHLTAPGDYDKITIRMAMSRRGPLSPGPAGAASPPASPRPDADGADTKLLRVRVAPARASVRADTL